jgi:hypothetical protein
MFTHSAATTPVPPASPASPAATTPVPPASPASPAAPARKRKRDILEPITTPPPRRRAKTQRFASEEAQKAVAADVRAQKNAAIASKKTVKNIHSQRMRALKDSEVSIISIIFSFHVVLF